MADIDQRPLLDTSAERHERFLFALKLQEIEGNPLSADDIAMFEMFDREGFTDALCSAYIAESIKRLAAG